MESAARFVGKKLPQPSWVMTDTLYWERRWIRKWPDGKFILNYFMDTYNRSTVSRHGSFIELPSEKLKQTLHVCHRKNVKKFSSTAKQFCISYEEADNFYGWFKSSEKPVLMAPLEEGSPNEAEVVFTANKYTQNSGVMGRWGWKRWSNPAGPQLPWRL